MYIYDTDRKNCVEYDFDMLYPGTYDTYIHRSFLSCIVSRKQARGYQGMDGGQKHGCYHPIHREFDLFHMYLSQLLIRYPKRYYYCSTHVVHDVAVVVGPYDDRSPRDIIHILQ